MRYLSVLIIAAAVTGTVTAQDGMPLQERIGRLSGRLAGAAGREHSDGGKCGFWLTAEMNRFRNQLSAADQATVAAMLQGPPRQKERVIGHFHIFYDTIGINQPALLDASFQRINNSYEAYVDSVGRFFSEAWNVEIDSLGFLPPPFYPGQSQYEVYISDLKSQRWYGVTRFDLSSDTIDHYSPVRVRSYIEVDDDFQPSGIYYTRGMNGLKVTAAHEFNHAIQLGQYGYWPDDLYFYEMTSTWLEDYVYHGVNDYLQYLHDRYDWSLAIGQFAEPDVDLRYFNPYVDPVLPYSRAIFCKFLQKKYSPRIMPRIWDYIGGRQGAAGPVSPFTAIGRALTEYGSGFRSAFIDWAVWNWIDDTTTYDTASYYTEGRLFPRMTRRAPVEFAGSPRTFADSIQSVSTVYRQICLLASPSDNCNVSPKMLVTCSNLNTAAPVATRFPFTYDIARTGDETFRALANGLFVRLNTSDPQNWVTQESDSVRIPTIVGDVVAFPNPLTGTSAGRVSFRLPVVSSPYVHLTVITSSGNLAVSLDSPVTATQMGPGIIWDTIGYDSKPVPSGIYLFRISDGEREYTGKIAVVRP